jgi:hypothetical protein
MSGFGITLSIYLEQANKLDGICNYFIYLSAEHFIYMYDVQAAYDVRAAVYVRIWDYFINLSGAGK